jgi:hypothetical protein
MWPFTKRTARQREIRRSKAERRGAWYRRLPSKAAVLSGLGTAVTAILAVCVLSVGGDVVDLREGQVIPRAITARIKLQIEDQRQTDEMRRRARQRSPNYYKLDEPLLEDIRGRLASALTQAKAHGDDPQELRRAAAENKVLLDEAGLAELRRLAGLEDASEYEAMVAAVVAQLKSKPLVEPEPAGTRRTPADAVLLDPTIPSSIRRPMTELRFSNDAAAVAKVVDEAVQVASDALRPSFRASILAMLQSDAGEPGWRPLYRFDTNRTVQVAQIAYENEPPVVRNYAVGDVLADAGVVTAEELELLRIEEAAYAREPEAQRQARFRILGRTIVALLVVFGTAAYMGHYQGRAFRNHLRRAVSTVVLLVLLILTRFAFVGTDAPPHFAVGMQALAAGLLAVVYSHGVAFPICGALAILITMAVQEGIGFFVVLSAVSGTIIFGLRVVRNRGKIVLVGAAGALIAFVSSMALGALDGQLLGFVLRQSLWAAGAVLMAGFIVEGVLPGIERVFRLSTGMTLLEWCDASKQLLRMTAAEAPGTYNHSMMVGTLAEAAAGAIGANGLLCRAGAYYHDIGKINKPEYFVENQTPGFSRHEKLSPAMSLLVIIGHVKDGIEMAKEYGLPASLHPFIPEHHGTTVVEYFYHAATKARRPEDPEVSDAQFRYPGPKPQSRETAIVMLADGVEGAVRAMSEPTPNRIETVVSDVIRKRLDDGQFDECDLTFRELAEIEKSLVKSLCGIYHARIKYPSKEPKEQSAAS